MNYPFVRLCDRGSKQGRPEIVFSENHGWEEAQVFGAKIIDYLNLIVNRRIDGPDAWLWELSNTEGRFVFAYDDFPCETCLVSSDIESDKVIESIYIRLKAL
jgi:hypothetical protein